MAQLQEDFVRYKSNQESLRISKGLLLKAIKSWIVLGELFSSGLWS